MQVPSPNPKYPKPPITEAVIDFRFTPEVGIDDLRGALGALDPGYPKVDELLEYSGSIQIRKDGVSTDGSPRHIGFRIASSDGKHILQLKTHGFSFSRLAPYVSWESMRDEAKTFWDITSSLRQGRVVNRAAVRYINLMNIPAPADLKDYLRVGPDIPANFGNPIQKFLLNLQLAAPEIGGHVIINETIVPPKVPGTAAIVLDLDVIRTVNIPQTPDELWGSLEQLHQYENSFFEKCLQAQTRELFK
jgi:uncharacterized protein (TIGR04255 family)